MILPSAVAALLCFAPAAPSAAQAGSGAAPAPDTSDPYDPNRPADYWYEYRPQLEYHPVGYVVPEGRLRLASMIPMHPSGFVANTYGPSFRPTYGLGKGWEVAAGGTMAERFGAGGKAIFYGLGLQKQFISESKIRPAVSVGAYGMVGPHDHRSGSFYLAGTKWAYGSPESRVSLFLSGGVKAETYDGDDYGNGTGVRPFVGAMVSLSQLVFIGGEISPKMPWERENQFALRAIYLTRVKGRKIGVGGGIRNNGFDTQPFIGIEF